MDQTPLRSTKQQIVSCLETLAGYEFRSSQRPGLAKRFSTYRKAPPLDVTVLRQFAMHCRLLRLADAQFSIESTTRNQLAVIFLAHKLEEFFWRTIARLPSTALEKWDSQAAEEFLSKDDVAVYVTRHIIHSSRLRVFQRRREFEHTKHVQKMFRHELLKSEQFTMELDVETQQELLRANLMDVDDACVIIQCAERMYQAIARFCYLTEVRKKAIDLHAGRRALDAERAVIMIQARTRGFLARKHVQKMRADEQRTLALSMEAMLFAQTAHRRAARELESLQIQNVLYAATASASNVTTSNSSKMLQSRPTSFNHPRSSNHLRMPETLGEYLESVRSDLFITDPLQLTTEELKQLTIGTTKETFTAYNQDTENLFAKLSAYCVCRVELGTAKRPTPTFDELTTFEAEIRLSRKHSFSFDLRNFLYVAAVIPHASVCSGWPIKRQRQSALLLVGAEGSGKTAWANALAHKCGSARITITRSALRHKNRSAKLLNYVLQFLRRDEYVVVILDLMDIFKRELEGKKSAIKNTVRGFLRMITLEDRCLVVGASCSANLESSILDHFVHVVLLKAPPNVNRLQLLSENFSRRLENDTLARLPKRLAEVSKSTSDLTCGNALRKVNRKFARNMD